ncbi:alpha-(1,3)-fucosyltransferase 4-like isoform X1 [Haliotis rufescens]|uniref:alpha-(1,3)-fucosyltransferase 4-like isoform X1 n=2 Tax=Haliotis rufescens TaxID=6454 RepID=UPI00201EF3DA|nr:alpha-(1,3)-fucosyltransferase 4-like isoform X1 [Haliotis rufescens]
MVGTCTIQYSVSYDRASMDYWLNGSIHSRNVVGPDEAVEGSQFRRRGSSDLAMVCLRCEFCHICNKRSWTMFGVLVLISLFSALAFINNEDSPDGIPMPLASNTKIMYSPPAGTNRTGEYSSSKGSNIIKHYSTPANLTAKKHELILWYFSPRYLLNPLKDGGRIQACPEAKCLMTRERSLLNQSKVVIFSAEQIKGLPPQRPPGQVWIFHNNEPPYLFSHGRPFMKQPWSSVFNWTMDFRHDSDIYRPYAILRKREHIAKRNYTSILQKKNGLVAWMVSNCLDWSGRLAYARELKKYIDVDIFGACGQRSFPRTSNNKWMQHLNITYKFYLGFENLHCQDYISEKFFNNFNLDLVTVVRGGGNYSRDAPNGTYINADDFKSPKELADHLLYLNNNTDKYIEILRRKDNYYYEAEEYRYIDINGAVFLEHYHESEALCNLCDRLHRIHQFKKSISDIVPWFTKGICKEASGKR